MSKAYENLMKKLHKLSAAEEDLERKLKTCKAEIAEVQYDLLAVMQQEKLESVKGKYGRAWIKPVHYPKVNDWDKVYAYVAKHNAFDLLQRRIGMRAYEERVESGKAIPGITLESGTKLEYRRK